MSGREILKLTTQLATHDDDGVFALGTPVRVVQNADHHQQHGMEEYPRHRQPRPQGQVVPAISTRVHRGRTWMHTATHKRS